MKYRIASAVGGAVVVCAVSTAALASPAMPAKRTVATHVTVHYSSGSKSLYGRVSSTKPACVAGRTVAVYQELAPGAFLDFGMNAVTSKSGSWKQLLGTPPRGTYMVKVKKRSVGGVTCAAVKSPTYTVH